MQNIIVFCYRVTAPYVIRQPHLHLRDWWLYVCTKSILYYIQMRRCNALPRLCDGAV